MLLPAAACWPAVTSVAWVGADGREGRRRLMGQLTMLAHARWSDRDAVRPGIAAQNNMWVFFFVFRKFLRESIGEGG